MIPYKDALRRLIAGVFNRHTGTALSLLALAVVGSPSTAQPSARALEATNLVEASFGSVEIGVDAPSVSPKATDLFHRTHRESAAYADCGNSACPPQILDWRESIASLDGTGGLELLTAVNAAINERITYRDDLAAYGEVDYWATPTESLTGYGDCEDYAIVKYLSLVELGIPHDRMRIVIVRDNDRGIGHAVLAVTLETDTYILDNVLRKPTPDSDLAHYQPIYSFNMNQQWLNVAVRPRTDQVAAKDADRDQVSVIPPASR